MTARILVVDDVPANLRLLEAQLTAEYFDVASAASGVEALSICERAECDLVLLDVMMPDMDGFEVCRRLKSNPSTQHIPVVMITALDQPSDRVRGLDAGADDFLTKPTSELVLIARVRSLVRLKMMTDELRMRALTSREIGLENPAREAVADTGSGAHILIVEDRKTSWERMARSLASEHIVDVEVDPRQAMFHAAEASFDLAIVSLGLENYDGLRLCSRLRSLERTRNLPLLAITDAEDNARLMRGLEIGVNDYLIRPVDQNELLARVRTQIKKKRFAEKLRDNVQMSIEAAITDALTGLHNRRYMEIHLGTLVEQAGARGRPLSILVLDIDFFKAINDGYGHSAGDLKEFSRRLKKAVRGIDLACRFGGEEFVVVMPDTSVAMASMVAERLRKRIATEPFRINQNTRTVQATISVGIAAMRSVEDRPSDIIRRADEALYRAKRQGRNRVVADAA
jgi:two-component system cell cycle response regulator